jgi:hypothetical protein
MAVKKVRSTRRKIKSRQKQAAPSKARRAVTKSPLLPALALYREQRRIREQVARDRAQRYSDFLKQTKNLTEAPAPGIALRALAPAPGKENLRILAEGDSWFDYPLPVTHGDGVIYQLQRILGYPIANMAHYGLEVEQMMGLSTRQEIISRLSDPQVKYDALLFSGGGNDLVGDQFCIWLRDAPPVVPPAQMLDENAAEAALAILEAEYRELVDIRDQYSPETVIFVHAYDFPPITGIGVCGVGPWLKPSLDYAYRHLGVESPDPNDEFVVVKTLMEMFDATLDRVAADPKVQRFVVVPTQGALTPTSTDWQNEIHPSSAGFLRIAQKFQSSLASVFP